MGSRIISSSPDRRVQAAAVLAIAAAAACSSPDGDAIALADGSPGIGFDDLRWSSSLGRVIAPGGRSGIVDLVDPETKEVTPIGGFSRTDDFSGGHDDGPTSADEARGLLFVTDRTNQTLSVVDPRARAILSSVALSASPDYVRFVEATNEIWVSEPAGERIEIFAFDGRAARSVAWIDVPNGPESLVVDQARGMAYTHEWQKRTIAIDVKRRAVVGAWPNGCAASRGIDVEPEHGWVLAACNEGTLAVLDPNDGGRIVSAIAAGAGYDVIGYARTTRHVYLAGSACACLTVVGLATDGRLRVLGRFDAPSDTHCVAADDRGHAFVCAPSEGGLRRIDDGFPSWGAR
jgi:DNA-binding beta-propeller fold protein YncE